MRAIVYTEYGPPDVLHIAELEKPIPKDSELLVKVYARSVNFGDLMARNFGNISPRQFNMPMPLWIPSRFAFGWRRPRKQILGSEFAGVVEAVGQGVTRFKAGDEVFGYRGPNVGCNAEYLCMAEDGLVAAKPTNVTFEEAAAVPYGALTALSLLRKVGIQSGQKVLINGASGGIGSYAVQLAKYYGAEVTGTCGTPRVELVKALGADYVIDYTREDFTQNGRTYNLIFDILGRSSFSACKKALTENGRYLLASFKTKQLLQMLWTSRVGGKKVICALSTERLDDLKFIKELVEAGEIRVILDRCFAFEQAAEAHRYVEAGHKAGQVVIVSGHA